MIFKCVDWPGGIYATPTYSGSRAGGNIAVCWAVLNMIGREGYVQRTRRVIEDMLKLKVSSFNSVIICLSKINRYCSGDNLR